MIPANSAADEAEKGTPDSLGKPKTSRGISRRALVEGAIGAGALFALGGVGVALAGEDLMRPPGGQDESRFLGACIRCDKCRSICPEHAISISLVEDGIIQVRTPKMDFRQGYCTECKGDYRCIKACPTGALLAFDTGRSRIGLAVIEKDHCMTYTAAGKCSFKCIDHCPTEALYAGEDSRLHIIDSLCWGCGACEFVCPSNSYGSYKGSKLRGINVWPERSAIR